MKKLVKLFLLIYSISQSCCVKSSEVIAISQIIRDFYVKNSHNFDFIIFVSETRKLKDLVNDVLKVTTDVSPYKLIEVENDGKQVRVQQSAILMFENLKAYFLFHALVRLTNDSPRKFNFLVYIDDFPQDMKIILNTYQPLMLAQESFIQKNSTGSMNLLTYSKFQQPNCASWTRELVNEFSEVDKKWKKRKFFIEKFNNFNGCDITTTVDIRLRSAECDIDEDGNEINKGVCHGIGILINEEIGRHLNYTSRYEINDDERFATDHVISVASLRIQEQLNQFITTNAFTSYGIFILISRNVPFTQFEKLFLPFEIEVWICLIATMSTGVLTILVVKLAPRKIQNFVFGCGVNTPLLNFVIVIYGLGMIKLPRRNFARFLLMCFILFCLIFRTAYQSKQFEFLTKEMRRPDVKTINDLIKQNFTFSTDDSMEDMTRSMEPFTRIHFKKGVVSEDDNNVGRQRSLLKKFLSDGSKTAMLMNEDFFQELLNHAKGHNEFTRLQETVITDHVGFFFPRKNFMTERFNRKLMQLNEAGISEKIVKTFEKQFYVEKPDEHVVLTLTHLGFGFYIWLGCLGISSTFFLLEKLFDKFLSIAYIFIMRQIKAKIREYWSYVPTYTKTKMH